MIFKMTDLMIYLLQMLMIINVSVSSVVVVGRSRCCLGGKFGQFCHGFDDEYLEHSADDDVEDTGHTTHKHPGHLSCPHTEQCSTFNCRN